MWASYKGHTEVVRVLMKYNADPNITAAIVSLSYNFQYHLKLVNFVAVEWFYCSHFGQWTGTS